MRGLGRASLAPVVSLCRVSPRFRRQVWLLEGILWVIVGLRGIPSGSLVVPPSLTPSIRWGTRSGGSVHRHRGVVQPSGGVGRVELPLPVVVRRLLVLSLEGRPGGLESEVVESSGRVSLYRINQLPRLGDVDHPRFQLVVHGE